MPRPVDHAPLSAIRGILQCTSISSCKSSFPLSGVKRCLLLECSVIQEDWLVQISTSVRQRFPLLGVFVMKSSIVLQNIAGKALLWLCQVPLEPPVKSKPLTHTFACEGPK